MTMGDVVDAGNCDNCSVNILLALQAQQHHLLSLCHGMMPKHACQHCKPVNSCCANDACLLAFAQHIANDNKVPPHAVTYLLAKL